MSREPNALLDTAERHAPLAPWTTWGIGGPAEYLLEPDSEEALVAAVQGARRLGLPVTVIGRGSNVLIDDAGVPGLVLLLARRLDRLAVDALSGRIEAQAGVPLPRIAQRSAQAGVAGLTFLIGIPGSLGGGVVMNAGLGGRTGRSVADVLESVRVLHVDSGSTELVDAPSAGLRYRGSAIQDRGLVVLGATMQGIPGGDPRTLANEARALREQRKAKQPLQKRTSGSVFTQPEGHPPAGRLIDAAGLKGYRIGDAAISMTHANWIENAGHATAADVRLLMEHVEQVVHAVHGVRLEREVRELPRPARG